MNNLYAHWCAANGRPRLDYYAFKCTAASSGNDQLPDLRASSRSHFVATTVDLLTTGVDVPCVRNIVFFKYLKSPISFYQMVGRGTRIDAPTGKLMFRVYYYTDATRLFGEQFITKPPRSSGDGSEPEPPQPSEEPTISVEGFEVHITHAGRFIVADVDGRAMPVPVEEYRARLAARLVQGVALPGAVPHPLDRPPLPQRAAQGAGDLRLLPQRGPHGGWPTGVRPVRRAGRAWLGPQSPHSARPHPGFHLQARGLDQRPAGEDGCHRAGHRQPVRAGWHRRVGESRDLPDAGGAHGRRPSGTEAGGQPARAAGRDQGKDVCRLRRLDRRRGRLLCRPDAGLR